MAVTATTVFKAASPLPGPWRAALIGVDRTCLDLI
jgi:hypothetical protein